MLGSEEKGDPSEGRDTFICGKPCEKTEPVDGMELGPL